MFCGWERERAWCGEGGGGSWLCDWDVLFFNFLVPISYISIIYIIYILFPPSGTRSDDISQTYFKQRYESTLCFLDFRLDNKIQTERANKILAGVEFQPVAFVLQVLLSTDWAIQLWIGDQPFHNHLFVGDAFPRLRTGQIVTIDLKKLQELYSWNRWFESLSRHLILVVGFYVHSISLNI